MDIGTAVGSLVFAASMISMMIPKKAKAAKAEDSVSDNYGSLLSDKETAYHIQKKGLHYVRGNEQIH